MKMLRRDFLALTGAGLRATAFVLITADRVVQLHHIGAVHRMANYHKMATHNRSRERARAS
jgi:hypothetical protein